MNDAMHVSIIAAVRIAAHGYHFISAGKAAHHILSSIRFYVFNYFRHHRSRRQRTLVELKTPRIYPAAAPRHNAPEIAGGVGLNAIYQLKRAAENSCLSLHYANTVRSIKNIY